MSTFSWIGPTNKISCQKVVMEWFGRCLKIVYWNVLINSWVMVSSKLGVSFGGWNYGCLQIISCRGSANKTMPWTKDASGKNLWQTFLSAAPYSPEPTLLCVSSVCVFLNKNCIGLSIVEALWFCYQPSLIQWKDIAATINFRSKQLIDRISLIGFNCQELVSHHGDSKESLKEGGLQIGLPKHLEILNANADGGFFGGFFGVRIVVFFFFSELFGGISRRK